MANVTPLYSTELSGLSSDVHARIGKIASAVNVYIESESDLLRKRGTFADLLFNVHKSNHASEAFVESDELGQMDIVGEGDKAPTDGYKELRSGIITHHQFMKTVNVSQVMIEDSNYPEIERVSRNLVRSYYATRNGFAVAALLSALSGSFKYGGKTHTAKTGDNVSLCHVSHLYTADDLTQSNRFSDVRGSGVNADSSYMNDVLNVLQAKGRMLKTEVGEPTGYAFQTIIIPGNRPKFQKAILAAIGSDKIPGKDTNDINTQYGLWNVVIIPTWESTADELFMMSDDANKMLDGNKFYDRVPFNVRGNYVNNTAVLENTGRARMGVGFGNYRHILHFETLANGQSTLVDGGTAGTNSTDIDV